VPLPEWTLELMRHFAADFPYAAEMSTAKRLIFVQQGESALAWALMVDKTSGSPDFRYLPQRILIQRGHKMEIELLFHIPRSRKLIEIYQPYLEQVRGGD
jgi:hypothetical protein